MVEDRNQQEQEGDFIKLGGMARDAIAEVDGPSEIRWRAGGVVGEAGEEASDAPDGNAQGEWDGVEIAGGGAESDVALGEFDDESAEDEGSDDGFTSVEIHRVGEVVPGKFGVFEPEQQFGAEGRSRYGRSDHRPADRCGDRIAEAAAECQIGAEGDEVGESFEEDVRVDGVTPKVYVDREICRSEME